MKFDMNGLSKFFSSVNAFRKTLFSGVGSLWKGWTGSGLTDQQIQQNEFATSEREAAQGFEERMSNTAFQRQVADMRQAGVNPALLYGAGSNGASTPSSSGMSGSGLGSPATMSDLMQLYLLKPQLENLRAQSENTRAEAALTRQKTLTEEHETGIKGILRNFLPGMQQSIIDDYVASANQKWSQKDLNDVSSALAWAKKEYQDKENAAYKELFDLRKELLKAEKGEKLSDAEYKNAMAWLTRVEAKYEHDTGFKMSSSALAGFLASAAEVLGLDPSRLRAFFTRNRDKNQRMDSDSRPSGEGSGGGSR